MSRTAEFGKNSLFQDLVFESNDFEKNRNPSRAYSIEYMKVPIGFLIGLL